MAWRDSGFEYVAGIVEIDLSSGDEKSVDGGALLPRSSEQKRIKMENTVDIGK